MAVFVVSCFQAKTLALIFKNLPTRLEELYFGAFKSTRRKENLALLDELGNGFSSLPFEGSPARRFGQSVPNLPKPVHQLALTISKLRLLPYVTALPWDS